MIYAIIDQEGKATAFYDSNIHRTIPAEAGEITPEQWQEYLSNQGMKRFVNGRVVTRTRALVEVKAERLATIEQMRLDKCKAGVSFGGKTIPTDKDALLLLQSAQMFVGKNPTATFKKAGLGEFNAAAIEGIITAVGNMQRPVFARESELYNAITAATTLNELDAIDIEAGW